MGKNATALTSERIVQVETYKIVKSSGRVVSCIREVPEDPAGIVIAVHGFTSSKTGPTYQLLLESMPAYGLGAAAFDLPGHGTEESAEEPLRVPGAIDSIEAVERDIVTRYPGIPVYYFASSFGAYLTGLYISSREHAGRKAFFRSAAVNMPALFIKEDPTEKEKQQLEDLERQGWFDTDMDLHAPVRITRDMYNDLMETDLFERFDPEFGGRHQIRMVHGAEDDVIDPAEAVRFAEKFSIPLRMIAQEGHSLSNDPRLPGRIMREAAEFFRSAEGR